jgi:hypothetical protein
LPAPLLADVHADDVLRSTGKERLAGPHTVILFLGLALMAGSRTITRPVRGPSL